MMSHGHWSKSVEELVETLTSIMGPESASAWSATFVLRAMRLLCEGSPVAVPDVLALSGLPHDVGQETVGYLTRTSQLEFDASGRLSAVAGLSLSPTRHSFRPGPVQMYTWCAIDTLFIPALLERTADVSSKCPVSGVEIRLTVSPDSGIDFLSPEDAVVSIMDPSYPEEKLCSPRAGGRTTDTERSLETEESGERLFGEGGSFCGNVCFFRSSEDAAVWRLAHPGALILPARDAHRVAVAAWAEPVLEKSVLS